MTKVGLMGAAACLCALALGCGSPGETATPSAADDYAQCVEVISAAYTAFNAYDLEKCLSYLEPGYAEEARPALAANMEEFLRGKGMGIRLVPTIGKEPLSRSADRMTLCVTMSVRPGRPYPDEHYVYELVKLDGAWKIIEQRDDPDWESRVTT